MFEKTILWTEKERVEKTFSKPPLSGAWPRRRHRAKLSEGDVREIRELASYLTNEWSNCRKANYIKKKLHLPVSVSTIYQLLENCSWVVFREGNRKGLK